MPNRPLTSRFGTHGRFPTALDGEIFRLSAIAFLTLVTEPLFLLADSAIVGHLGTDPLAGLSVAAAVVNTVVGLCVFLAYGTTAAVSRLFGAGRQRAAYVQGVDGVWLAVFVGAVITLLGVPLAGRLVALFGPDAAVARAATGYLRIALAGAVPMLVMLAAVGVLRGTKDLRVPLYVAVAANLGNIGLNYLLVYPAGLGIEGSALGSLIAQSAAAAVLVTVVCRRARAAGAGLRPDLGGVRRAGVVGVPLIVRTLMLRAALLIMTAGAASLGSADLAAMQLTLSVWSFLAFALDALGITAQTLVGNELGAGDPGRARALTRRLTWWGAALGVLTGLVLLALAGGLGRIFTTDARVLALLTPAFVVAAIAQPVAGVVFTLDGILIGAGDNRYLAWAQSVVLVVFAPLAWAAVHGPGTLAWLWASFAVGFMCTRAVVLVARARGDTWLRLGTT